eukprot:CAMPEP_0173383440 /NCGR_PEP_ID=MMETSP1356-20130122/6025_1 /TAXON_ID=77927 ORGANISM="Hemiselmis virescens, Strain PCC157" /NCGR_SAMPLE_ID=MMETSP1356 /ASSEMBLY_ACC=CAM_ASM_000847 /LENGTH=135 /DNA_ID=CAMNT_0014338319 /DNA_START=116 /DNA_END=520 /DNA_ORIENTATION=+
MHAPLPLVRPSPAPQHRALAHALPSPGRCGVPASGRRPEDVVGCQVSRLKVGRVTLGMLRTHAPLASALDTPLPFPPPALGRLTVPAAARRCRLGGVGGVNRLVSIVVSRCNTMSDPASFAPQDKEGIPPDQQRL